MNVFLQGSNINRPSSGTSTTQARAKSAVTRTRKDSSNGIELTINDILHPEHAHLRQETNTVCKMITIYKKNSIRSIPILNTFPCHVHIKISFEWIYIYFFNLMSRPSPDYTSWTRRIPGTSPTVDWTMTTQTDTNPL